MTAEGFKFQASVKDNDGDMVNVRADSVEELDAYLSNFPVAAYAQFKANVRGGAALAQIAQPQAQAPVQQEAPAPSWATGNTAPPQQQPQQSQGWGAAQPQQQSQGGGGGQFGGPPHPEGKTCDICPKVLEMKKTSTGKGTWRCPDWRWGNGNPNGHSSEWMN